MRTLYLIALLVLSSCASLGPNADVKDKISKYKMAAKWTDNSSTMIIYCNGGFSLDDAMTMDNLEGKGKESGGFIKSLSETEFKTGPLFGRTYKINKLPYELERPKAATWDKWRFTVDEREWSASELFNCELESY